MKLKVCKHCGYNTTRRWNWIKHRANCSPDDFPGWGYRTEAQRQELIEAGDTLDDFGWSWYIWIGSGIGVLLLFLYLGMTGGW